LHQSPRNAQFCGARLARNSTPIRQDEDVELVSRLSSQQWLLDGITHGLGREIGLEGLPVNGDITLAGPQKNSRHRTLAAASAKILNDRCHSLKSLIFYFQ